MSAGGMDFPGLGVIPYDPPSEDLRPFMAKKLRAYAKLFRPNQNGVISLDGLTKSEKLSNQYPEERRDEIKQELMTIWHHTAMVGTKRDSITVDQFVEEWLKRVYSGPEARKELMQKEKECAAIFFKYLDTKGEGRICFSDYVKPADASKEQPKCVNNIGYKVIFDALDTDKDGVIRLDDFIYGSIMHHLVSGPESQYSYLYGPIED